MKCIFAYHKGYNKEQKLIKLFLINSICLWWVCGAPFWVVSPIIRRALLTPVLLRLISINLLKKLCFVCMLDLCLSVCLYLSVCLSAAQFFDNLCAFLYLLIIILLLLQINYYYSLVDTNHCKCTAKIC